MCIDAVDEEDDLDHNSYVESDEDMAMSDECPEGHMICSPCRGDLPEEKCTFGYSVRCTAGNLARSLSVEHAVESILVDCHYAKNGCTENTAYYYHVKHRLMCPHAPCECPEPGCDLAGKRGELLDHLTAVAGHHKWPSTTFQYWVPFDLRIVEPGTHVLRCKNDGQLFLVS
ncbi:putative E3 ubiquitin-protein ligase SINA-like 6 [Miscanthus floridulus]|uniref:putative E3 ubiquitin-protein ligase SINA-like 6 n=1 Tax=Miscanthus floridulus TaxID=154761 RepID=UPI0034575591